MTRPRYQQILPRVTPYYHVMGRCTQGLSLMGERNPITGENTADRKGWIETHLEHVARAFCIDVCKYALMDNHYHLLLHINMRKAKKLPMAEVIYRWHMMFEGDDLSHRYIKKEKLTGKERRQLERLVKKWRKRLWNISWFMRCFNQYVSYRCNSESGNKGTFWQSRYKIKGLFSYAAILACCIYIDLNPVRAGLALTPETSDYTSFKKRLDALHLPGSVSADWLYPFRKDSTHAQKQQKDCLPFTMKEYMELLDETGRVARPDKPGKIAKHLPPILERLQFSQEQWLEVITHYDNHFKRFIAPASMMKKLAIELKQKWLQGTEACNRLLPDTTSDAPESPPHKSYSGIP